MRFLLNPTDGALIPEMAKHGAEEVTNQVLTGVSSAILHWMHDGGLWFAVQGVPILAELTMLWGLICIMLGISGKGKWLERGTKTIIISIMLGMVKYAI